MDRGDRAHVLIAGGGVAALEAVLALRSLAEDRVTVELLAPEPHFRYRPLAVAEPFGLGKEKHFELAKLAREAGASFTPGRLLWVDSARHVAHTSPDGEVPYSMLLVACGAVPKPAVEGALTFRGGSDREGIEQLLRELEAGDVRSVAFAVPAGAAWSLPAYELALMTAAWLARRSVAGAELSIVTPEQEPLHIFGREASDAVGALLAKAGIAVHARSYPIEARDGELVLGPDRIVPADRVVALPRLHGPRIGGVPQTSDGFIPVDLHGRVPGLEDVYAAGDITDFAIKQGGIAAQQAEVAAEAIAAAAGVDLLQRGFRPVLRGLLLTGGEPHYLRGERVDTASETSYESTEFLWWPPAKIAGRHLTPFLAELSDLAVATEPTEGGVQVEVELDPQAIDHRHDLLEVAVASAQAEDASSTVGDIMRTDPLVVAPEDTLGEVAERMFERGIGSALVAEYGRLIGIITAPDMLHAIASRVHSSEARARQWMTADPIAVAAEFPVGAAAILMTEHHIHHLPVVDGERPIGIVGMREVASSRLPLGLGIGLGF